jgi:hypothetical protein
MAAMPDGSLKSAWQRLREAHPLVHCITNQVSMDVRLACNCLSERFIFFVHAS